MTRAWRNGRFVPADDPDLPTLTGGDGLFETILVTAGEPRFLDAHLARLFTSADRLSLPVVDPVRDDLRRACEALAAGLDGPARMRVALTGSDASVTIEPFAGYPAEIYREGVTVEIDPPGHPLGDRAGHKVLPYSPLLDARTAARGRGAFEILFTDVDGALLEGSASNLFVVTAGRVRTPSTTRRILPGVTRAEVLLAAAELGLETEETDLFPDDLPAADEAFLTGSLMEVVPIRRVGDDEVRFGEVAGRLRGVLFPG